MAKYDVPFQKRRDGDQDDIAPFQNEIHPNWLMRTALSSLLDRYSHGYWQSKIRRVRETHPGTLQTISFGVSRVCVSKGRVFQRDHGTRPTIVA